MERHEYNSLAGATMLESDFEDLMDDLRASTFENSGTIEQELARKVYDLLMYHHRENTTIYQTLSSAGEKEKFEAKDFVYVRVILWDWRSWNILTHEEIRWFREWLFSLSDMEFVRLGEDYDDMEVETHCSYVPLIEPKRTIGFVSSRY